MATRVGSYVKQRLRDVALTITWLVVLFQVVQIARIEGDSTTRHLVSYAIVLAIGVVATGLWWRGRNRARSGGR